MRRDAGGELTLDGAFLFGRPSPSATRFLRLQSRVVRRDAVGESLCDGNIADPMTSRRPPGMCWMPDDPATTLQALERYT